MFFMIIMCDEIQLMNTQDVSYQYSIKDTYVCM